MGGLCDRRHALRMQRDPALCTGCLGTNEPCPSDPSTCCSGSCGPMGGYATGDMPFVCSDASGETRYAAMEPVGNDTLGAMLGSGCVRTNEPCPSGLATCCSCSCGPIGGYLTGKMPLV